MTQIVGIYIRLDPEELKRLVEHPEILPKYDHRVPLADGRALDLGRAWEPLGVFIDGGYRLPPTGPTVGVLPLPPTDERATWSYIEAHDVQDLARSLKAFGPKEFALRYEIDADESQEIPDSRTGGWGSQRQYMFKKLEALKAFYAVAAAAGQGMLVRIGERV